MGEIQNTEQSSPKISSPIKHSPNACTNSSPPDPDTKSTCPEFESRTGQRVVVSAPDLRKGGSKKPESKIPKKKRPKKKRNCSCCCLSKGMKQKGEKVGDGRKLCNSAASFGGDCAAVCCCCPCALVHLCILALVKFPLCFAKKVFCCSRKGVVKDDDEQEDKQGEWRCYTPPWSSEDSPQKMSNELPLETQKIWSELYADGRMGFGGMLFERSREHQSPSPI